MNHKTFALLPLILCTAFGSVAVAADTDITFKGEVIESACIPTVNGSTHGIVTLDPIFASQLSSGIGATAGAKTFTIELAGCSGSVSGYTTKAYFYQAEAMGGRLSKNTTDMGSGQGWQYQILNAAGDGLVDVGTSATVKPANNAEDPGVTIPAAGGNAQLTYTVRYYRNSVNSPVPGSLDATATYVLFSS